MNDEEMQRMFEFEESYWWFLGTKKCYQPLLKKR